MKDTKIMNKLAATAICVAFAGTFISCEQEFYKDEQYRKEIFIVSGENNISHRSLLSMKMHRGFSLSMLGVLPLLIKM